MGRNSRDADSVQQDQVDDEEYTVIVLENHLWIQGNMMSDSRDGCRVRSYRV